MAGYNGTFTVTAIPSSRSFQYTNPISGLATSGGGTVTLAVPGATESGTTVTISTAAAHGFSVGQMVVDLRRRRRRLQRHLHDHGGSRRRAPSSTPPPARPRQLGRRLGDVSPPPSRSGSAEMTRPLSAGPASPTRTRTSRRRSTASPDFAGTVTVSGAASTGFTVTYGGASAGLDVPNIELVNLSCGGCFASVEETNHGGANDSFTLNYNGTVSALITNGTNYTAAGCWPRSRRFSRPGRRRPSRALAAARSTTPASR